MGLNQKRLTRLTITELMGLKVAVGERGQAQVDKEIRRRDRLSRKRAESIKVEATARWFGRDGPSGDEDDLCQLLEPFNLSMASYAPHGLDLTWLTIFGEPKPKERPRFSGGRVLSSKAQKVDQKRLREALAPAFLKKLDGTVAVACLFYRSTQRHVDIDNLIKQVFDAANGIIWHDDAQVTACIKTLEVDREHPRTVLGVVPYPCSVVRNLNRSST